MPDATQLIAQLPIADRLARIGWTEVVRDDELGPCWEWNGSRHPQGYGQVHIHGRTRPAHRLALEAHEGTIPDGMHACHRCDNPPCVNPAHLYAGTPSQNTIDFYDRSGIQRQHGERHHSAKFSAADVESIRSRYSAGGLRYADIASEYGVNVETIARIIRRETWQ